MTKETHTHTHTTRITDMPLCIITPKKKTKKKDPKYTLHGSCESFEKFSEPLSQPFWVAETLVEMYRLLRPLVSKYRYCPITGKRARKKIKEGKLRDISTPLAEDMLGNIHTTADKLLGQF